MMLSWQRSSSDGRGTYRSPAQHDTAARAGSKPFGPMSTTRQIGYNHSNGDAMV